MVKKKIRKTNQGDISKEIRHLGVIIEDTNDKVSLIAEQYGDIRKTLDTHTEMIGSMKVDVEVIKTDIEFIKNSLKKKVDLEEFEALEKRVRYLESKMK